MGNPCPALQMVSFPISSIEGCAELHSESLEERGHSERPEPAHHVFEGHARRLRELLVQGKPGFRLGGGRGLDHWSALQMVSFPASSSEDCAERLSECLGEKDYSERPEPAHHVSEGCARRLREFLVQVKAVKPGDLITGWLLEVSEWPKIPFRSPFKL
jgi:hypothetical protein